MYLLTNTNIVGIYLFYDPTCCCLADYGHGVSKVWCKWSEDENVFFLYFVLKSDKNPKNMFQKRIDPISIGSD
mgnify:CR=1 FL=1